jgi:hypothetical protein
MTDRKGDGEVGGYGAHTGPQSMVMVFRETEPPSGCLEGPRDGNNLENPLPGDVAHVPRSLGGQRCRQTDVVSEAQPTLACMHVPQPPPTRRTQSNR